MGLKRVNLEFFVPGLPKGLKRHRTYRTKSGRTIQVDPSKADKADFLSMAMAYRPAAPLDGPLAVAIVAVFPRPRSHYRKNGQLRPGAPVWYASAPDWDNVAKFVSDSLTGVFWQDDRQIALGMVYAIYGDVPGVAVLIRRPSEEDLQSVLWALGICRDGKSVGL